MSSTVFVGIDLSGPSNTQDTAVCCFDGEKCILQIDLTDSQIIDFLQPFTANRNVFVAIDAPLTYQEGGGYRDLDRVLRQHLNSHGFAKIGVMAPTMTKMAYLTLRGLRIRELLQQIPNIELYETHPGAALVFSNIDYQQVIAVKSCENSRKHILEELTGRYQLPELSVESDHELMAISAMLSAKRKVEENILFQFQSKIVGQPLFIL